MVCFFGFIFLLSFLVWARGKGRKKRENKGRNRVFAGFGVMLGMPFGDVFWPDVVLCFALKVVFLDV